MKRNEQWIYGDSRDCRWYYCGICAWTDGRLSGMSDLISRDAAIAWFFRPYSNEECYSNIDVERALEKMPAVDAVVVVRCKDCKY